MSKMVRPVSVKMQRSAACAGPAEGGGEVAGASTQFDDGTTGA